MDITNTSYPAIKSLILFTLLIIVTACGGGSNDNNSTDISATDFYKLISNTVKSADLGNGEIIISFYNGNTGGTANFQIGISKDAGQTYKLLIPDMTNVSSYIPDGIQAYPVAITYSDTKIILAVTYYINADTPATHSGVFVIDRATLDMNFVAETPELCSPAAGIEQADGSWLFTGRCNSLASIFTTDSNLANIEIVDQLPSNSHGGYLRSLIAASDHCLYAAGHNWETINTEAATHIVIRRSCDQGVTWVADLDFYNPGHAYSSANRLYEFNSKIQFYGQLGEDPLSGTSSDVSVITAERNDVNDWTLNKLPGTTVSSSSPAYYIAYENGSCNMASVSLLTNFETNVSLSTDCGISWGSPKATTYGRMTSLTLNNNVITFYHYTSEFYVNQVDFSTAQTW